MGGSTPISLEHSPLLLLHVRKNAVYTKGLNYVIISESILRGDLLRSLPHIKIEVKLNFQANSESNSK